MSSEPEVTDWGARVALRASLENLVSYAESAHARPPGFLYSCIADYVLREGRPFVARPKPIRYKWRKERYCYENSMRLVAESGGRLRYVEGYGVIDGPAIPVHHAWAVDLRGRVVDVTWRNPRSYYGVEFDTRVVVAAMLGERRCAAMIDDWEHDWPLLRGETA